MPETSFTVKKEELKIIMERVFDAPRELVWKIITDPKLIPQWWGPARFETVVDKMDFQVGGQWRFVHKGSGQEFAFHGVYKKIEQPSLIADTFNFEGVPEGHEMVETMVLEDLGNGKTKAIETSVFQNIQDLEGMAGSGMENGAVETWERLAKLVKKINNSL